MLRKRHNQYKAYNVYNAQKTPFENKKLKKIEIWHENSFDCF